MLLFLEEKGKISIQEPLEKSVKQGAKLLCAGIIPPNIGSSLLTHFNDRCAT